MSSRKGILSLFGAYGAGDLASRSLNLLLLFVMSAHMAPGEYGTFSVAMTVFGLLCFVHNVFAASPIFRLHFDYDADELRGFLGAVALVLVMEGLLVSLAFEAWGAVKTTLVQGVPYAPYVRLAVWTAFFAIIPRAIPLPLYRAQMNASGYVTCQLSYAVLRTAIVGGVVVAVQADAALALRGELAAALLAGLPYAVLTIRWSLLRWHPEHVRALLRFALPLLPHHLAHWALTFADRLILSRTGDLAAVGVYSFAYSIAMTLSVVYAAMNNAWQPYCLARATDEDERERVRESETYFTAGIAVAGALFTLAAGPLLQQFAPAPYRAAVQLVPWISLGIVLLGLSYVPVNILFLRKRTRLVAICSVTSAVANVMLNLWLAPAYGAMGAAVATALSYGLMLALALALAAPIRPWPLERLRLAKMIGVVGGAACAWLALDCESALLELGLRLVGFAVLCAAGLALVRFATPEEMRRVRAWGLRWRALGGAGDDAG